MPEVIFGCLSNCDHNVKEERNTAMESGLPTYSQQSSLLRRPTASAKRSTNRWPVGSIIHPFPVQSMVNIFAGFLQKHGGEVRAWENSSGRTGAGPWSSSRKKMCRILVFRKSCATWYSWFQRIINQEIKSVSRLQLIKTPSHVPCQSIGLRSIQTALLQVTVPLCKSRIGVQQFSRPARERSSLLVKYRGRHTPQA
jgi:hypothetical protein